MTRPAGTTASTSTAQGKTSKDADSEDDVTESFPYTEIMIRIQDPPDNTATCEDIYCYYREIIVEETIIINDQANRYLNKYNCN